MTSLSFLVGCRNRRNRLCTVMFVTFKLLYPRSVRARRFEECWLLRWLWNRNPKVKMLKEMHRQLNRKSLSPPRFQGGKIIDSPIALRQKTRLSFEALCECPASWFVFRFVFQGFVLSILSLMHSFAFENDESQVALSFCCRAHSLIFGCVFVWRP